MDIKEIMKNVLEDEISEDMIAQAIKNNISTADIRNALDKAIESFIDQEIEDVVFEFLLDNF